MAQTKGSGWGGDPILYQICSHCEKKKAYYIQPHHGISAFKCTWCKERFNSDILIRLQYIEQLEKFQFTPNNLVKYLHFIGPWSTYGLASEALKHYFPEEYDDQGDCSTAREAELLGKLNCDTWQDVIIKYHTEVGYVAPEGFNHTFVNTN